ncbi:MAG: hypothetical protein AAGG08_07695, partial [Actinomycetota bacterium]
MTTEQSTEQVTPTDERATGNERPARAWGGRPSLSNIADDLVRVRRAAARGDVDLGDGHAVVLHDLDLQARRFDELRAAFPADTLHAVAVKANPLIEVLRPLVAAGAGC